MNESKIIQLGEIVRISDPCYPPNTWCAGTIENILPGDWNVYIHKEVITDWGERVCEIKAIHNSVNQDIDIVEPQDFEVGVDSGLAGIFDLDYFNKINSSKEIHNDWYGKMLNELNYLDYINMNSTAAICRSGFGDGSYTCYIVKEAGKVVGIRIEFITEAELQEEEPE